MNEPDARWDGRQWVSKDGLWAWDGAGWVQYGSKLPAVARVGIYAAVGLGLNFPILWVLALVWGLTGPGWDANPPDVMASLIQIALTLGGALFTFSASWFLVRIDRRDWWSGAVFAWPWIASAAVGLVGSSVSQPPDAGPAIISAGLLLFAGFPLAGSIVGRRRQWSARSAKSTQPSSTRLRRAARAIWLFLKAFVTSYLDTEGLR